MDKVSKQDACWPLLLCVCVCVCCILMNYNIVVTTILGYEIFIQNFINDEFKVPTVLELRLCLQPLELCGLHIIKY